MKTSFLGRQDYVPLWRAMQEFTDTRGESTPIMRHGDLYPGGRDGLYGFSTYTKTSAVLSQLRGLMGEEVFYDAMRKLIAQYEGRIDPGDVFIFNDPYAAEGQHLPDIYITTPIFSGSGLRAWATTVAHHSDVGGIVAGSNALGAEGIFQEGLRLPIVKFMERGEPNRALWEVIALNVRTPDKVMGDLQSQLAACNTGERELNELFVRYGRDTVMAYFDHLHELVHLFVDASGNLVLRMMRHALKIQFWDRLERLPQFSVRLPRELLVPMIS